jgi:hypothetical protein
VQLVSGLFSSKRLAAILFRQAIFYLGLTSSGEEGGQGRTFYRSYQTAMFQAVRAICRLNRISVFFDKNQSVIFGGSEY